MTSSTAMSVGVIIVSDRGARGERQDGTAPLLADLLGTHGFVAAKPVAVADEREAIAAAIQRAAAAHAVVLTSGGTGIGPRDVTPEATRDVIQRELPGVGEAMRAASRSTVRTADLSRALAGTLGGALVINLPGSPKGACQCLESILPLLVHGVHLLRGAVADCRDEVDRIDEQALP